MRAYKRFKLTISCLLVGYFILSYAIPKEVFPFFVGRWFVQVPHTFNDFGVKVMAINGKPLSKTVYLDQNENPFKNSWAFRRYIIAQNLGKNIIQNNEKGILNDVATLQLAIFHSKDVEFDVDRRTFNSLEFIKTGKLISSETIFSSKGFGNE